MKKIIKTLLSNFGFYIKRGSFLRFEAMTDGLRLLKEKGFSPTVIIDSGSNIGQWAHLAILIWPNAEYHLIEPLHNCRSHLELLRKNITNVHIHPFAVSAPGVKKVSMQSDEKGMSTGSFVYSTALSNGPESKPYTFSCPATTLDDLFKDLLLTSASGFFLKLDIQRHEPQALMGATALLKKTDFVLCEVEFLGTSDRECTFKIVTNILKINGFDLFDIVSLSGRERDNRLREGDILFIKRNHKIYQDKRFI